MSTPIDTPERRAALRESEDLWVLRKLARKNGMSLQRLRRVGGVRFTLGVRGATTFEERQRFGLLEFLDDGRLVTARLYGHDYVLPDYETVSTLMESGPQPDSAPHDTATGPIALVLEAASPALEAVSGPIALPTLETVGDAVLEPFQPITAPTHIVAVPLVITQPVDIIGPETGEEHLARELPALPGPARVWAEFVGGLTLVVQFAAVVYAEALTAGAVGPGLLALSGLVAAAGVPLALDAIRSNDARLELFQIVGLQ